MNWFELYKDRVQTAEQAVMRINSNMRVFLSGNCSVPRTVLAALTQRAPALNNVEIVQVLTIGSAEYVAPEMDGHLRVNTLFISENVRSAVNEGRADYSPCFLSEIPILFREGHLPLDVAMIQVSPPDDHGFCSFGVEVGVTKPAAQVAKCVIGEINTRMPRSLGDSFIHISKLDVIVKADYLLPEMLMASSDEITERIADHVATLIPDNATLQTGIGGIPDAVLKRLTTRNDLGIHTELFSDGVIDLVNRGVITGEKKTLHPGKIVAGFCLGSQKLYEFVNDNPVVELHPSDYVNDPFVIAQNDNMVAINSAIEVDLTGQVCADSIGTRFYSGVGGQIDFIYGASRSKGGIPIIALPAKLMKKDGSSFSKIVTMLKPGAGVTTTRNHVHYIVTEYGIAYLYGKKISERAESLINIAAPEFRDELRAEAKKLKYL